MLLVFLFVLTVSVAAWALPDVELGGQSIGVLLQTDGVTVVALSPVVQEDGTRINPAADAGIRVGDFITAVDGKAVSSNEDIAACIESDGLNGSNCSVSFIREKMHRTVELTPVYSKDSKSYRIGLSVRDNAAGVGTLTFREPESNIFGALGHPVTDQLTGVQDMKGGHITRATITGIRAGKAGHPGEKIGIFADSDWYGDILINDKNGIYGHVENLPDDSLGKIAVATAAEVETGPAVIYTVIEGETVEEFAVDIVRLPDDLDLSGRGMIVRVTDDRLLAVAGGIVQGMSGSPIVQNDKLVGAVTHVFINDPTQGYACFAEKMLEEAGVLSE